MTDYNRNLKRKHKGWFILALIFIAIMLLIEIVSWLFN